jgi:vacuolar-type H+-ATPase subunit B/Vma2
MSCVRYRHIIQESASAISQGNRYLVREMKTELSQYEIAVMDSLSRLYFRFWWEKETRVLKSVRYYR